MAAPQMMKRDRIVEDLRRKILSGELPRGARMPQDDLARQFDASITPVREALRLLEAEGLLVSEPHRGVRVAGVDLDKVKATYVVRRLVESYAMQRVTTRLSPRDLARARSMIEKMETESDIGDVDAFRHDNREFHFFFYERCGMPALSEQIEGMWQAFPWDLMLNTPERTHQSHLEHVAIIEAIESGDVAAVAAATEAHIAQGFDAIARRLTEDVDEVPDPFLLDID
jgi:DNA-binding GntR family transcriptional regulator